MFNRHEAKEGHESPRRVAAPEQRSALVEALAHFVQPRHGLVEPMAPALAQGVEELGLFVAAPERVVRADTLELFDLGPRVFQEMAEIAHRSAPLRRQTFGLLATDGQSPFQCGTESKVMDVQESGREPSAEPLRTSVHHDGVPHPDGAIAQHELERFENAAW